MDEARAFTYRAIVAQRTLTDLEKELGTPIADTRSWRPREIGLFPDALRREAARMARLYEVFYCLERSVRDLVRQGLTGDDGSLRAGALSEELTKELNRRRENEIKAGFVPRTGDLLDYATLGELGQIIEANWDATFHDFLANREATKRLLANFNTLRSPVAHSIPVPMSEATRLGVFLGDWFRLTQ